jgi:hypothetical protein
MQTDQHVREAITAQAEPAWTPAVEPDGQPRPGAEVCELTGWVDVGNWPDRTRVLCRREDAHPGAQLRFTDLDGHRFQVFLTDRPDPNLAALELRHRQRARVEDRIRAAKAAGLANLPFDRWRHNAVWLELVLGAQDLVCWTQALLLTGALAVAELRPCATGCSTSPPGSAVTPAGSSCACKPPGPGRPSSPPRSPARGPCRCAANPPPTRADDQPTRPGSVRHGHRRPPRPAARHSSTSTTPASGHNHPKTPLTRPDTTDATTPRPHEKPRLGRVCNVTPATARLLRWSPDPGWAADP